MSGPDVRTKWRASDAGQRYAEGRWSSARRRTRDARRVAALLDRHLSARPAFVLDAPCGAGRLAASLAQRGRYAGLDVSPPMLAEARRTGLEGALWLGGDVRHLPFRDSAFDAVVCCRLLHHLDEEAIAAILVELVRVSRGLVIVSFWSASSLPALRRAWFGAKPGETRRTLRPSTLIALLSRAGAEVVGWRHSLRFLARQAFVAARKRPG